MSITSNIEMMGWEACLLKKYKAQLSSSYVRIGGPMNMILGKWARFHQEKYNAKFDIYLKLISNAWVGIAVPPPSMEMRYALLDQDQQSSSQV